MDNIEQDRNNLHYWLKANISALNMEKTVRVNIGIYASYEDLCLSECIILNQPVGKYLGVF